MSGIDHKVCPLPAYDDLLPRFTCEGKTQQNNLGNYNPSLVFVVWSYSPTRFIPSLLQNNANTWPNFGGNNERCCCIHYYLKLKADAVVSRLFHVKRRCNQQESLAFAQLDKNQKAHLLN